MTEASLSLAADVSVLDDTSGKTIHDARILIADDEPLSVRLLASILEKQGFRNLRFAEGGQAALDLVQSFQPDLVLLDMQMPDIDGLEVCRRVRSDSNFVDIPFLVQTATVNRKQMGELFTAGASDFLSKPINPSELVARVIVHLERRNLLRELREYRERISRELDAARRMQFELLPSPTVLRDIAASAGLQIASYNRSSSEIGGDLWGVLPIDGSRFGVFLADFTGHGVNAALNTFRLHALIHEYRALHEDPAGLVSMLNERLVRLLPPGQFATFLYVVVDHVADELRLASAGAPSPIVTNGLYGSSHLIDASGIPLGITCEATYEQRVHPFTADSRLLVFSDGLPEFTNGSGERIGETGLVGAIDACHPELGPHEIIDRLCQAAGIKAHSALPDDTTIICIDRRVGARMATGGDRVLSPSPQPACVGN
jgi:sigma-B regulation protein RsbU (phosphoserine phosphatase)